MKNNYTSVLNIFQAKLLFLTIISVLFFSQMVIAQCPGGTAAHYKLDELSGATTFTDFANNNDGNCVNGVSCPTATDGIVGGAQQFNGVDQFIEVPASLQFDFANSFSIEAWVRLSTTSTEPRVIVSRTNNADETIAGQGMLWWLGVEENTNVAKFVLRDNNALNNGTPVVGTTAINDGNWHQVVGTYDHVAGKARVYVDGVEETEVTISFSNDFAAPGKPLRIGNFKFSDVTANSAFFDGAIDNVGIFSRNLCDTEPGCVVNEVLTHYNNGIAGTGICPTAPVITSTAPTNASIGVLYTYQVEATGDPFPTFSLTVSPPGMTIDANTGLISWTPQISDAGTAAVTVQASSSEGSDSQSFSITVTEDNDPPTFDNLGNQVSDEDAGTQTVTGWATNIDDGDPELNQNLTFNITNNTNTALFATAPAISETGVLTYTTNNDANGTADITVTLDDDGSPPQSSTPVTFTITVNAVNDAPEFTLSETAITRNPEFDPVTVQVTPGAVPSDEVVQTVTYSISPQSVDFATVEISPTTGEVTITPSTAGGEGTQEFQVVADDNQSANNTFSQSFTFTVEGPTAIGDSKFAKSLSVFPVPGAGQITLSMENDYLGMVKVKVFDMTGRIVKGYDRMKNTQKYTQELNLGDIKRGTYLVQIVLDKDVILEKLLMN